MQQSKAHIIKSAARSLKSSIAARKAEYVAYRYGSHTQHAKGIPAPGAASYELARPDMLRRGRMARSKSRKG